MKLLLQAMQLGLGQSEYSGGLLLVPGSIQDCL
jgi:hypothetical protein